MTNSPESAPAAKWRTPAIGNLSELAQARVEAINIVQWLARIANSYVIASTPESRTRLEFRVERAAIATAEFDRGIALEIRLPMLELQFLENGKPMPHVFDPEEHSPAELEAWLLVELLHRGIERQTFSKELPYAIAGLMSGDAEDYSPSLCRQGLIRLTALMRDAAAVLHAAVAGGGRGDTAVACLPQNLNLMSAPGAGADSFAFSPGDAANPEPYFYRLGGAKGDRGQTTVKASTLMAERDPAAAAVKLKQLAAPG